MNPSFQITERSFPRNFNGLHDRHGTKSFLNTVDEFSLKKSKIKENELLGF